MWRGHYKRIFCIGKPLYKDSLEVASILDFYMGEAILQRIFMLEGNDIRFFMWRGHYKQIFCIGKLLYKESLCKVATILGFYMGKVIL